MVVRRTMLLTPDMQRTSLACDASPIHLRSPTKSDIEGTTVRRRALLLAGFTLLINPLPVAGVSQALAQMDWLTPGLESQRYDNLRRHQQRRPTYRQQPRGQKPAISLQRMRQLMRQIEPEYRRRVRLYGQARADEWLKRTAYRIGVEEGRRARRNLQ